MTRQAQPLIRQRDDGAWERLIIGSAGAPVYEPYAWDHAAWQERQRQAAERRAMGVPKQMPEVGYKPGKWQYKGIQNHRTMKAYDMTQPLKAPMPQQEAVNCGIIEETAERLRRPTAHTGNLLSAGSGNVIVSHLAPPASMHNGGFPMDDPRPWYIYALIDPRTDEVRYVGVTIALKHRLAGHIRDSAFETTRKAHWIKQLLSEGLRPILRVIEQGHGHDNRIEAEIRWIAHYRATSARLTNHSIGGDGATGSKWSEEQRAKIIGRKLSVEARQKISKARKGQPMNPQHRERLIAAHTGKPLSEEHRQKIRARHMGRILPREGIEKMAASLRGRKNGPPSEETRRKLSQSKIGMPQFCGICKSPDHNRRTCPCKDKCNG